MSPSVEGVRRRATAYALPTEPASHVVDKEYSTIHWEEQRAAREVNICREVTADKQSQRCGVAPQRGKGKCTQGLETADRQPARE